MMEIQKDFSAMQLIGLRFNTVSGFSNYFNQSCSTVKAFCVYLFFYSIILDKIVALGQCEENEIQQQAVTLADALTDSCHVVWPQIWD